MVFPRFLDRVLCNFPSLFSPSSEGLGRQVSEGAVGSLGVELGLPLQEFLSGILKREEPGRVEAFGPEPSVEALDVSVVSGFTWPGEVKFDFVMVRPLIKKPASELRSVINPNGLWVSARC